LISANAYVMAIDTFFKATVGGEQIAMPPQPATRSCTIDVPLCIQQEIS